MVLGIDEVGRGAWAGPLVVGAVVLGGIQIDGLTDSKKLTPKKRHVLVKIIKEQAAGIGLGWVSAKTIDEIGLSEALKMAARLAVKDITTPFDQIIIDGTVRLLEDERVSTIKQADLIVPSVSAASIIAKVARDYYMSTVAAKEFPVYSFEKHVGYGTSIHHEALLQHGPSSLHRHSFAPIQSLSETKKQAKNFPVTTKTAGHKAEDVAAGFLVSKGFILLERNWRTKWCEIDIVCIYNGIVHFVEVKHREKAHYGDGLAAITTKKLKQMRFAAELWRKKNTHEGDARLSAIATSGKSPKVVEFLENLSC